MELVRESFFPVGRGGTLVYSSNFVFLFLFLFTPLSPPEQEGVLDPGGQRDIYDQGGASIERGYTRRNLGK